MPFLRPDRPAHGGLGYAAAAARSPAPPIPRLLGRLEGVVRDLAGLVVRQAAGREDRDQRDARHDQEADLERAQPRFGVDAHRLLDLLGRRRRALHDLEQPVVGDEVDVVEIDLRLDLGRQPRIVGQLIQDHAAQQADQERAGYRRADRGGEVLGGAAQRADVARELLGRGGDQHVEEQRDERSLAEPEHDEPDHDDGRAPVVAHDPGEPQQGHRADDEAELPDAPRGHLVVEPHDQHRREEHREVERQHRDGRLDRRAALDDLDVERHGEVEHRLERDDGEQRKDRRAFLARRDDPEVEQRGLARLLLPPGPGDEGLQQHDADHDHHRRGRQAEKVEGCAGPRHAEAPAVEVVEAEADQDDGGRGQHHAHEVDPHILPAFVRLQPEAQEEHDRRDHDQEPEHGAPADEGAEHAADQERRDAGGGARRSQGAHGGRLLPAVIVVGDQRDQRRHDHRRGEADQALRRQHHGRDRAERHQHLPDAEQRHHDAEDARRPEALDELGAQHDEARDRERVHDDARADRGRRHAEALDHAADRDRQGGDVERHDRLAERDGDHRHPGFARLGACRGDGLRMP